MHDTTEVAKKCSLCMTDQHEWIGAASSALCVCFVLVIINKLIELIIIIIKNNSKMHCFYTLEAVILRCCSLDSF